MRGGEQLQVEDLGLACDFPHDELRRCDRSALQELKGESHLESSPDQDETELLQQISLGKVADMRSH